MAAKFLADQHRNQKDAIIKIVRHSDQHTNQKNLIIKIVRHSASEQDVRSKRPSGDTCLEADGAIGRVLCELADHRICPNEASDSGQG